ncbi:MAG TPA: HEAT repeat domain-containing protein, partial [Thermoanaerobaculia bacterium]|nr:HEAT repeat domain-containing protein [Thermoanaerobaculia bacterium]
PSARHGAAWALGRLNAAAAVEPLIALLGDSSTDVQHGAAWALGTIGDERAIPGLELLHDRTWSTSVRKQTKKALTRLGRHPQS